MKEVLLDQSPAVSEMAEKNVTRCQSKIKRKGPTRYLKGSPNQRKQSRRNMKIKLLDLPDSIKNTLKFFKGLFVKLSFGSKIPRRAHIPRFKCNIMITKCGNEASYGKHQDSSWILNSESLRFPTKLTDGSRLPTGSEMLVPTIVLARTGYTVQTKLSHSRRGVELSSITTGNNSAHVQSPGCQSYGIEHSSAAIKANAGRGNSNLARCVFTGRTGIDPQLDPEAYHRGISEDDLSHLDIKQGRKTLSNLYCKYDYYNVVSGRKPSPPHANTNKGWNKVHLWDDPIVDRNQVAPVKPIPQPQHFARLGLEDWEEFFAATINIDEVLSGETKTPLRTIQGIQMAPRTLAIKHRSKADVVVCSETTQHFLRKRTILQLLDKEGNPLAVQPIHTDRETGLPLYTGMPVCPDDIPLSFTAYSKATIDSKYPNIFVVHHPYKNEPDSIDKHIAFYEELREWRLSSNYKFNVLKEKDFANRYNNLPPIFVCGSGGSAQPAGTKPLTVNSTVDDPTYTIGSSQLVQSSENMAMFDCNARENAIAVMIDRANWKAPKRLEDDTITETGVTRRAKDMWWEDLDEELDIELQEALLTEEAADQMDDDGEQPLFDRETIDGLDRYGGKDDKDLLFMNYYRVARPHRQLALEPQEIEKRFHRFPGYIRNEVHNVSFLTHPHWEFELKNAFDFDTILQTLDDWRLQRVDKYTELQVVDDGDEIKVDSVKAIISAFSSLDEKNQDSIRRVFGNNPAKNVPPFPESWVNRKHILNYLKQLDKKTGQEVFAKALGAQPIGSNAPVRDRRFRVDPKELPAVVVAMMAAAALRFDETASTRRVRKKLYAIPPTAEGADRLPDPLRRKPSCCPNPDADAGTCCYRKDAGKFLENSGMAQIKGFHLSYSTPDLSHRANCELVAQCLLKAIIFRLTGDIGMISQFNKWLIENRGHDPYDGQCLPTTSSKFVGDFIEFINSTSSGEKGPLTLFVSRQHLGAVPKMFLKARYGKKKFCTFLKRFVDSSNEDGLESIVSYLQYSSGVGVDRKLLRDMVVRAINTCSGIQPGKDVDFIVHKAISDVESTFPDISGCIETSSIAFGSGSRLGLRILTRNIRRMSDENRFEHVYKKITNEMDDLDENMLLSMGYKRDSQNEIVSWLSGRKFSRTDVEHWCCKVYLCMTSCHPSRTISLIPKSSSPFCWPLPNTYWWVPPLAKYFKQIWDAFIKLPVEYLTKNYPAHLRFPVAIY